jgi:hypothetical protein
VKEGKARAEAMEKGEREVELNRERAGEFDKSAGVMKQVAIEFLQRAKELIKFAKLPREQMEEALADEPLEFEVREPRPWPTRLTGSRSWTQ